MLRASMLSTPHMRANAAFVFQALNVLRACQPAMASCAPRIDSPEERRAIERLPQDLLDSANVITDEHAQRIEAIVGSDVAGVHSDARADGPGSASGADACTTGSGMHASVVGGASIGTGGGSVHITGSTAMGGALASSTAGGSTDIGHVASGGDDDDTAADGDCLVASRYGPPLVHLGSSGR